MKLKRVLKQQHKFTGRDKQNRTTQVLKQHISVYFVCDFCLVNLRDCFIDREQLTSPPLPPK